ncbi:MAG: MucR family transcriptional regulator [Novosphingobium sp.]|uniref:MucR family transcriptional regulator n=1 Tax=Novosphingobium sp. TaxID=1874826 RepID=UPI0012CECEC5|nr:MucR family transcriptional regulator [Novosphingobium sp.]MPS67240.1 MucR family transcriptional regulator [Novosphingobium sp.]
MLKDTLLELTGDIVSAHVTNNSVQGGDLPQLISAVFTSLSSLGKQPEPIEEERVPAVSVRSSVKGDAIACLECGARQKTLKRHLGVQHGLTPEDYRARWKLPADYPMVAPDYAAKRAELAVAIGLGKKGGRKKGKAPAVNEPVASNPASEPDAKGKRKLSIKAG